MSLLTIFPEAFVRVAVMISLTAAFAGIGFLFAVSFLERKVSVLPVEYFGRPIVIGIALIIVFVSGINFLGIPLTKNNLFLAMLGICVLCILRLLFNGSKIRMRGTFSGHYPLAETLIPLSLFFALFTVRLIQLRDVSVPAWYDGLFYTSLLQEFILKSAIPFEHVHQLGFHVISVVVYSFWRLPLHETILLSGQWLSVICGLSFYIFARRLIKNVYAAGLSFVAYSFLLIFPSLLISWSRYSFLLGLAILPHALLTSKEWINTRKSHLPEVFLLVLSIGLAHSGLLLIWFSFILVYSIYNLHFKKGMHWETISSRGSVSLRPFMLVLPILTVFFSNRMDFLHPNSFQNNIVSQMYPLEYGFGTQAVFRLYREHDYIFIILWIGSVFWSIVEKRRFLFITLFWPLTVWTLTWLQYHWLEHRILTYANLIFFLSLPMSISVGLVAQRLLRLLISRDEPNPKPRFGHSVNARVSISLSIAMLVGIGASPVSMDHKTALFTKEDALAMEWIKENIPNEAGFLIRTFSEDNNSLPSDGGGWIPLLTGRRAVIPQTGELYDVCGFAADHDLQYLYFGKQRGDDRFDLRVSDLDPDSYTVVYGTALVEIVSLRCS